MPPRRRFPIGTTRLADADEDADMHRAVEVLYTDGRWYPGTLDRWRRCPERGWIGHVWWREAVGMQHVEWIQAERLRPG